MEYRCGSCFKGSEANDGATCAGKMANLAALINMHHYYYFYHSSSTSGTFAFEILKTEFDLR